MGVSFRKVSRLVGHERRGRDAFGAFVSDTVMRTVDTRKPYLEAERLLRDRDAPTYDAYFSDYHMLVEWQTLWRRLRRRLRGDHVVLDAGCGTGRFMERLAKYGARMVGTDLSHESLRVAWRKPDSGKQLIQADVRYLPFRDAMFDQVLCSQVVSHLIEEEDAVALLAELRRVMRPNAQLVISAFNYNIVRRVRRDRLRKVGSGEGGPSYRRYVPREFCRLLRSVFSPQEIVEVWAGLSFAVRPCALGPSVPARLRPAVAAVDTVVERTAFGFSFGHLLFAELRKHP